MLYSPFANWAITRITPTIRTVIYPMIRMKSSLPVLLVLALLLSGCSVSQAVKSMKFSVDRVDLDRLDNRGARGIIHLKVENPSWLSATVTKIDYTLLINDRELGTGTSEGNFRIEKESTSAIDLPVDMQFRDMSGVLLSLLTRGKMVYQFKGVATFSTFAGNVGYPFDVKKK